MFLKSFFPFLACLIATTTSNAVGIGPEEDEKQGQMRIVNGTKAEIGRYNYFARDENGNCGGFLVAPNMVLTAAQCDYNGMYKKGKKVVVGSYNMNDKEGTGPDFIEIKETIRHPKFDDYNLDNDYMLLVLTKNSSFQPAIIPENDDFLEPGDLVYAIGTGQTSYLGPYRPKSLLEVGLNTIENDECDKLYEGEGDMTKNMLCTFTPFKDACIGDAGGPLIKRGVNAENDVVVGITSWGIGCATEFPGVYARVSRKYDWIKTNVEKNGSKLVLPSLSPSETPIKSSTKKGKKKAKNVTKNGKKRRKKEKKVGKLSTIPNI